MLELLSWTSFSEVLISHCINSSVFSIKYKYDPLPKYKVSGIYKPHICRKLAARLRLIVAARLPQTRFSYANYFSGALFWHTMCATSMQRTVVAHCSGTQRAPQVCSAQLSHTVLVHNVRRKFVAHSCRTLFYVPQVCGTQLLCTALFCPPPPPPPIPPPPQPPVYHPTYIYFFSSLPPGEV